MSMCKGGDSTKEVSLNAVNYSFNPFFRGLQNSFPCGPCSFISTHWPPGHKDRGDVQGGVGRGEEAGFKHEDSSQSIEKEYGLLRAEGQAA